MLVGGEESGWGRECEMPDPSGAAMQLGPVLVRLAMLDSLGLGHGQGQRRVKKG